MPDFTFTGFVAHQYPSLRDSYNVPLGDVQPGDVADLPEAPPDGLWRPYQDGDGRPSPEPAPETSDDEAGEPGTEEG